MYPLAYRQKVLSVRKEEGLTIAEVAERFCVGVATVMRWIKNLQPKTKRNKPATKIDMEALKRDVERYPDAYQFERAKRLGVSRQGIWYALKRLGVSYKKNATTPKSRRRRKTYLPRNNQDLPGAKTSHRLP